MKVEVVLDKLNMLDEHILILEEVLSATEGEVAEISKDELYSIMSTLMSFKSSYEDTFRAAEVNISIPHIAIPEDK